MITNIGSTPSLSGGQVVVNQPLLCRKWFKIPIKYMYIYEMKNKIKKIIKDRKL